ncbi:MAG: PorT family protein [Bacteroidaceae bacterium]|nr:PorT family protein [Bacteroidaceae bacterium]
MKKMLLAITAMAFTATSFAQRASSSSSSFFSTEKSDENITFGVRVGMNAANMTSDGIGSDFTDNQKARIGFNLGVNVDIPITQSMYMQTGLYYTQKGTKWKASETIYGNKYKYTGTWNPGFLQIPILASYRYNFSDNAQLQVSTGPYFAVGVSGKSKEKETYNGNTDTDKWPLFGEDEDGDHMLKRFDAGWQIGLGVTIKKFFIGYTFEAGFSNLAHSDWWDDDESIKSRNHMINVGVNF